MESLGPTNRVARIVTANPCQVFPPAWSFSKNFSRINSFYCAVGVLEGNAFFGLLLTTAVEQWSWGFGPSITQQDATFSGVSFLMC